MCPTIEISEETLEKIKDQLGEDIELNIQDLSDLVGKKFFIRTVTYHLVGKVEKVFGDFIELSTASWVADSGRFMQAIKDGDLDEVEPTGTAFVNVKSIVDFYPWKHPLPVSQK